MNKNISRIVLAVTGGAMITMGGAGLAQAAGSDDNPAITQHATYSGTPHSTVDARKQADEEGSTEGQDTPTESQDTPSASEGGSDAPGKDDQGKDKEQGKDEQGKDNQDANKQSGKIPNWAIQKVELNFLDGKGDVEKANVTVDDIKNLSVPTTVQGMYNLKIPDSAKVGDTLDIKFYNGAGGDWKQNLRPITVGGEEVAKIESEDGQNYKIRLTKDVCGLEMGFSLVSNINGESDEKNNFDYTKATEAPADAQWTTPECSDSEVTVTETAPRPIPIPVPQTSTPTPNPAPAPAPAPQTEDDNKEEDKGGKTQQGSTGGQTSTGGLQGYTPAGSPVRDHDSQTVVSGGGFTDDSKLNNPKWNRIGGGESISAQDDKKKGPEVNTGGEAEASSFFGKLAHLFA